MSLTKLSLAGNYLIIPGQGEFMVSDIPAGNGKSLTFFYSASVYTAYPKSNQFLQCKEKDKE